MEKTNNFPQRGEIWLVKCDKIKEFSKDYRPGLVISGDIQNQFDEVITVVPLTTEKVEEVNPFEVFIENTPETGLDEPSKIVLNHPYTVFRARLKKRLGATNREIIEKTKKAWQIAFDSQNW